MINSSVFKTVALVALVSVAGACQAGSLELVVGKRLSAQELEQYASAPTVALESQSFKVLATSTRTTAADATSGAVTQVINENGVVGESRNNVVVSQVSVDRVKQAAARLSPMPVSAQYYGHINISTLHFASFQAAVNARTQLKKALPQARVDVPIQYAKPVVR
ncbi:hypothetical protein WJ92_33055 [Burkholderia ubonensis]|uniref:hypothetical protein n=1 Tax=Burkholderia ubonensis TaxID=101571 RepID=UPI00075AFD0B|nr:hypothetical protein [Burkholderia ubonensis]KVP68172.1 hypothetical protein WJ92_33055 [Burkholderia ubonensis]